MLVHLFLGVSFMTNETLRENLPNSCLGNSLDPGISGWKEQGKERLGSMGCSRGHLINLLAYMLSTSSSVLLIAVVNPRPEKVGQPFRGVE